MGVYKLSTAGGLATPRTNYSSFLAGNPAVSFGSYESIATVTVGSGGSANVDFTSIPATYTHLQIRFILQSNTGDQSIFTFNNEKISGDWSYHSLTGNGSSAAAGAAASSDSCKFIIGGTSTSGSVFNVGVIDILDYANTNKYKTVRTLTGRDNNGSGQVEFTSGVWEKTTAINRITFIGQSSWNQYTQFALYGIKGA